MTYAELFKAMRERCDKGSFFIEVRTWQTSPTDVETEWSVYVTVYGRHHVGATPEIALASYDQEHGLATSEPIERVSERVGDAL